MKHRDKLIRAYMAQLGRRPKRMSPAALAQRQAAGRRSGAARRAAAASRSARASTGAGEPRGTTGHKPPEERNSINQDES